MAIQIGSYHINPGVHKEIFRTPMPNPSSRDLESEEFEAIWQAIKDWDINCPDHYSGYCGANGSHVKIILDALYPVMRNKKIESVLGNSI